MIQNPFPGPQPYRASDRDRFYGREEMSYGLESRILANRCITVYGPSGAGKSSLVQAAVIPSLVGAHEVRAVRVDGWPEGNDPTRWLASAMYSDLGLGELPVDLSPHEAILAAAQRAARRSTRLVLVYLDQIEQLLYPGRAADEADTFFACLHAIVEMPLRAVRVVLSLREDYLGRFRDRLRDRRRILDNGFRVGPLNIAEITEALCKAAAVGEPPQIWSPEAMRTLLLQVRVPGQAPTDEAEAQAAYAQIVCRALFQERAQGKAAGEDGETEPILRTYLDATLEELGPLRGAAQRLLEDHLVTADGSRTLRTERELLRVLPPDDLAPVLRTLEGAAILHAEEHQGSRYFEIGHDWLARKVCEQRLEREREEEQRRREEAQQRALEQQRAEAESRIRRVRAERRTLAVIAIAALLFAAVTGALGFWAWQQKRAAEAARVEANLQKETAIARQSEAHDARILAGVRELEARGQLAWAVKLLPEVERPEERHGWIELASDALEANALRVTLRGHEASLSVAAWSRDGTRVLTASADGTARVFRADGKSMPIVLRAPAAREAPESPASPILAAAWSRDGERVLTASADGIACLFRADGEAAPLVLAGHAGPVIAAFFSPDDQRILTAGADGTARLRAADGGGEPLVLAAHAGPLTAAIWSPDGARVITAHADGAVRVWRADRPGEPRVLRGHKAAVVSLTVSPDGERIVSTSLDATARVWKANGKGQPVVLKGHSGAVTGAAVSPDGAQVATASTDKTARLFRIDGKGEPLVLRGHDLAVNLVAYAPDGATVLTASADKTARLWPTDGLSAPLVLRGHDAPIRAAAFSPDGAQVLTAASDPSERSPDHTAKVWSLEPLKSRLSALRRAGAFHAASFGAEGDRIVAVYDDRTARLFRPGSAEEPIVFRGHDTWVASAALSPTGDRVVTASFDTTARVYRADGQGAPIVLQGHQAEVRFAAFSPNGARIVTASDDRTARVWNADGSGAPIVLAGHTDGLTSAAWSPDSARIVTTSLDHTARVWNADGSGAPILLAGHAGEVLAAAFSPDGAHIATASEDHTLRLWDARGSSEPKVLRGHDGAVLRLAYSPDGKRLASSAVDQTVRLWRADGEGEPIVFAASAPALALAFFPSAQEGPEALRTIHADGTAHTWLIDIAALRERLRAAPADCLPPELRALYASESPREAWSTYAACERAHERTPLPLERATP